MTTRSEPALHRFPLAALVGQERMRLALLLALVQPRLGGVLLRGEKGTAKSTAARGLAELVDGAGFVDLPLGATEDRVVGHLDLEQAIHDGVVAFEPGLLARADGGILYIDEVNLLADHLVECLIDCCESGENVVERDGLTHRHPARFTLIGSMNPEEGDLRPQLLDRFALAVAVTGEQEAAARCELLRRRAAFDRDPAAFREHHRHDTELLHDRLLGAKTRVSTVAIPPHLLGFIAEIVATNHVQGHRAELAIARAARAHAAWHGRLLVDADDIAAVAPLALLHRVRNAEPEIPPPPPPPPSPPPENNDEQKPPEQPEQPDEDDAEDHVDPPDADENGTPSPLPGDPPETVHPVGSPYRVRALAQRMDRQVRTGSGRRLRTRSATRQGRYVRSTPRRERDDLALDATLRAAAPYQLSRRREGSCLAVQIESSDVRMRVRERKVGSLLLFCVDASGSMGAQDRMVATKTAILSLLLDAYQKRDRVGMVAFRGASAEVLLPPTPSVERAARLLSALPIGGRTPLGSGLAAIDGLLRRARRQDPSALPLVLLLTDGRANVPFAASATEAPHREARSLAGRLAHAHPQARFTVIDTEAPGRIRLGLARGLAEALHAAYIPTEELRADDLVRIVKEHRP